ncbi:glycosyltransferase family 4 protein [Fulvivirga lutimaris]|uniref:glycosyltransferase family 4 protein n=1 Tax=Fulvivirga lutimaris TaxID=1819566 RepID=UPI0012BBB3DC|nr:glycosyltransferase family 4 protein [Fulvivirga lutimaris]MTI40694.1 glycosyltransferase WbuB [Fulvivirga lutimaris]
MRICLIHQYYKTPETGGAIRSYYIAKHLHEQGHDVTVITARNNKAYTIENDLGFEVHSLPIYYENHLSFFSRIHAFILFVWATNKLLKKLPRFDLNYVISTPLSTALIALKAKKRFGTPFIFEVGDLWPEAPIQLKVIKNPILKSIALKLERNAYRKAAKIVALSEDIKSAIQRKAPEQEIEIVTNFADIEFFKPEEKKNEYLNKYQVQNKFVISYLGTVGMANELEYLINVAVEARSNEQVHFFVVGGGAHFNKIRALAESKGLTNITFAEQVDKYEVRKILNITDAIYVSFKNVPVLATGSPNKFFDGLAGGKLIIINFKGWIKKKIEQHDCGFYHDPESPRAFLELLAPYIEDENKLEQSKMRARELATKFSLQNQLPKLDKVLEGFN